MSEEMGAAWRGRSGERGLLGSIRSRVPLFDDERPHVVPRLLVVFGMGSVAVRELQRDCATSEGGRKQKVALVKASPFVLCMFTRLLITDDAPRSHENI